MSRGNKRNKPAENKSGVKKGAIDKRVFNSNNKPSKDDGKPGTSRDTRNDVLADRSKDGKKEDQQPANKPKWYYGDMVLADEISRFAFNQFVGQTAPCLRGTTVGGGTTKSLPNIMVLALNPCPGVSFIEDGEVIPKTGRGINLALQQWWSILSSTSGRQAAYTKNDMGALILELGEIISQIEHMRRFFGLTFNYTLRNRELPFGYLRSMGLDPDDFAAHLADYRMKFNTTILKLNKIPIPANINYFEKCQELYQKVYWDSPTDMAQAYVMVPATTWKIREDLVPKGTVLQTIPSFLGFTNDEEHPENNTGYAPVIRTFQEMLDSLNDMIDALMMSTTFSNIYADLLRAATQGQVNLWSFDLVDERYGEKGMFEYNAWFLLMVHNMMFTGNTDVTYNNYYTTWSRQDGTYWNDAILDVESDSIMYNPKFAIEDTSTTSSTKLCVEPIICDSIMQNPSADERIEMNVYKVGARDNDYYTHDGVRIWNMDLPDHYAVGAYIYGDNSEFLFEIKNYFMKRCEVGEFTEPAYVMTKFQWSPIYFSRAYDSSEGTKLDIPIGELNYWTLLDNVWYSRVNDAKFFGLFQIL